MFFFTFQLFFFISFFFSILYFVFIRFQVLSSASEDTKTTNKIFLLFSLSTCIFFLFFFFNIIKYEVFSWATTFKNLRVLHCGDIVWTLTWKITRKCYWQQTALWKKKKKLFFDQEKTWDKKKIYKVDFDMTFVKSFDIYHSHFRPNKSR